MSEASPSQDSSSLEETSNGSSPPLETQTPPSPGSSSSPPTQDSNSSPPSPDSDSSPPSPNSNSSPPSLVSNFVPPSQDSNSSPPSPAPPSNSPPPSSNGSPPPPNSSPSPPPPQDDVSSPTTPPPPPPKFTSPPPSNGPPPSPPSSNPVSPPPPNDQSPPPSNSPPSNNSPPPPSPPPLIVVLPPPNAIPVTPVPPNPLTPVIIPPVPETTTGSSQTPPLLGSLPNPTTPTESTPVKPSPSTPSEATAHVTPPSRQSASSSSSPASSRGSSNSSGSSGSGPIIGLALAGVVVALVAIFFVITRKKKRRMDALDYRPPPNFSVKSDGYYYRQENPVGNSARSDAYYVAQPQLSSAASGIMYGSNRGYGYHTGPPDPTGSKSWFTYEELTDITNGFARENLIGEGGFGYVYKGFLPDGRQVAVKQLKSGSGQGEREFRAEVEIISRVHHRHLVSLVGYCIAEYHRLLVYEFVPNNTLEHHLHAKGLPAMDWPKRVKLAIGSARGLAYLHEDCHPRIIHRDIKSANILLDDAFEAQVADFGLAKLSNDTHTHVSTRVMGTFGYMAPEYASSGKLTDRSDVFSFGVVLLELITGRKPVDPTQPLGDESLVEWARPLLVRALETGNCEELVDPRLENNFNKTEMFRMIEAAAACVRHSAPKRPRMVQVVRALDNDGDMLDLTNGVKFGQSQVFDSGQYSTDIQRFRRMAFGDDEYNSSEYGPSGEYERRSSAYSGEYHSRESSHRPPNPSRPGDHSSGEYQSSHESETRAMNLSERSSGGGSYRHSGRKFP